MKKILALVMALAMIFALCACGANVTTTSTTSTTENGVTTTTTTTNNNGQVETTTTTTDANKTVKAGLVCIGDENDQGYTYNFIEATKAAKEALAKEGINVEWTVIYNKVEGDPVEEANNELVDDGCQIIFNNSYGQEPAMLKVAADNPEVQFVGCTNEGSWKDNLENTHNAFGRAHEGRYLAGIVAGMKLQELVDAGTIKADEAIIGYVGAYPFAEVVSGYTAYYLGAKSVCPTVTMKVQYVNDWSDATGEANAAQALIDQGCVLISQHSDNTTPATTAEKNGKFHTGYNADMISAAPKASLVSTRINWTNYFIYAISAVAKGEKFAQDYCHGLKEGEVELLPMNDAIIAAGTKEAVEAAEKAIIDGTLKVFDTEKFTVGGQKATTAFAIDSDGDYTPDKGEAIHDGCFNESDVDGGLQSAPYFALRIDGITELNAK